MYSAIDTLIDEMMLDHRNYSYLMISLSPSEKRQFERFVVDGIRENGTDLASCPISGGIAPGIPVQKYSQGEYLLCAHLAQKPVKKARQVYPRMLTGTHRKLFFSLPERTFLNLQDHLISFMTDLERDAYQFEHRDNPFQCYPKNKSFGLYLMHSKTPISLEQGLDPRLNVSREERDNSPGVIYQ